MLILQSETLNKRIFNNENSVRLLLPEYGIELKIIPQVKKFIHSQ
jgi:hypothetical protein